MRHLFVALSLVILVAASCFAVEYPLTVAGVEVEGAVNIRSTQILREVPFGKNDVVEEAEIGSAAQAVYDLGWFSEVLPEVRDDGTVVLQVVEYPLIERIEIVGNINTEKMSIFGWTFYEGPILPTSRVERILRSHDIKPGEVLNKPELDLAVDEILETYHGKGYQLVTIPSVTSGATVRIEILEGRIERNVISGLVTVPRELARGLIEVPEGDVLQDAAFQSSAANLLSTIYFEDVNVALEAGAEQDSVQLVWQLQERQLLDGPVQAAAVSLRGITVFPQRLVEGILAPLPEGEEVGNYELLEALAGVYDLYYRTGYILVRFTVEDIVDGTLNIRVEEGVIGSIEISGNERTRADVVLRNLRLYEGEVLNRSRLAVSYQTLMGLGYFDAVDMVPTWAGDAVNVAIDVTETEKFGGFNGSVAFSPDTGGLVGTLEYHQLNLLGTGQDLTVSYDRGLVGDATAVWDVGYSTVSFFPDFDRVGLSLYRESDERTIEDETTQVTTMGGRLAVSYPWADYLDLDLAFKHENVQTGEDETWVPIEAISVGMSYDDSNNYSFPTNGGRVAVSMEQAGRFAPGEEYTKFDVSWAKYFPIRFDVPYLADRDQAVAVRIVGGWGIDLPTSVLYDFGGATTVRGAETVATGQLLMGNLEYRVKLVDGMTTALFVDGGVDFGALLSSETEGELLGASAKAAMGVELSIDAAGMLVRLDVAWVFEDGEFGAVPKFEFGFGPMF
ncbi:BamA/TamA family outer membrane protein [Candidatus Bipolaricaulota bacterium]|nr:BamA/TamA family outer membrane protein [Candidatus Bipolaricaulota bacterium]